MLLKYKRQPQLALHHRTTTRMQVAWTLHKKYLHCCLLLIFLGDKELPSIWQATCQQTTCGSTPCCISTTGANNAEAVTSAGGGFVVVAVTAVVAVFCRNCRPRRGLCRRTATHPRAAQTSPRDNVAVSGRILCIVDHRLFFSSVGDKELS